eukprot:8151253-Alexandrium_andersonii.AAC.1
MPHATAGSDSSGLSPRCRQGRVLAQKGRTSFQLSSAKLDCELKARAWRRRSPTSRRTHTRAVDLHVEGAPVGAWRGADR